MQLIKNILIELTSDLAKIEKVSSQTHPIHECTQILNKNYEHDTEKDAFDNFFLNQKHLPRAFIMYLLFTREFYWISVSAMKKLKPRFAHPKIIKGRVNELLELYINYLLRDKNSEQIRNAINTNLNEVYINQQSQLLTLLISLLFKLIRERISKWAKHILNLVYESDRKLKNVVQPFQSKSFALKLNNTKQETEQRTGNTSRSQRYEQLDLKKQTNTNSKKLSNSFFHKTISIPSKGKSQYVRRSFCDHPMKRQFNLYSEVIRDLDLNYLKIFKNRYRQGKKSQISTLETCFRNTNQEANQSIRLYYSQWKNHQKLTLKLQENLKKQTKRKKLYSQSQVNRMKKLNDSATATIDKQSKQTNIQGTYLQLSNYNPEGCVTSTRAQRDNTKSFLNKQRMSRKFQKTSQGQNEQFNINKMNFSVTHYIKDKLGKKQLNRIKKAISKM